MIRARSSVSPRDDCEALPYVTTFDHERLDVYQCAIDFIRDAQDTIHSIPPGAASLADQLRRASTSICLNIAEGSGEFSRKEKARFYRIAKRSATECAAIIDILTTRGTADSEGARCRSYHDLSRKSAVLGLAAYISRVCLDDPRAAATWLPRLLAISGVRDDRCPGDHSSRGHGGIRADVMGVNAIGHAPGHGDHCLGHTSGDPGQDHWTRCDSRSLLPS